MEEKTFTLQEIDEHADSIVKLIKESRFKPDTIIGIITGGAIIGKIVSLKLGMRFCPDYRRYSRESVYFPLPIDARKILVIDDRMVTGETFKMCARDIMKKLKPALGPQTFDLVNLRHEDIDVRFLAFLNDDSADFAPHYSLFNSIEYEFPWSKFEQPFSSPGFRKALGESGLSWAIQVMELCDALAPIQHPGLEIFYQNRPLSSEILINFLEEPGEIVHLIELDRKLDLPAFLESGGEAGLHSFGNQRVIAHINEVGTISIPFRIEVCKDNTTVKLSPVPQEDVRSLYDMCKNCEYRPNKTDPSKSSLCLTCTAYVKSRETLQIIVRLLNAAYGIKNFKTVIKTSKYSAEIGEIAWNDIKKTRN